MSEGKTPQRERIDEVLAAWPEPQRSTVEWDEAAEAVVAKLESADISAGVSDEDLLASPLPASPEEVQRSAPIGKGEAGMTTAASSRQRDRTSLKELAKMADMAPPSSSQSRPPTSGIFAEAGRASQPPAVEGEERKENSGLIHLAALAEGEAKKEAAAAAGAVATAAPAKAVAKASAPAAQKKNGWLMIGGMMAAAAVAAGAFMMVRGSSMPEASPAAYGPVNPPGQSTATAAAPKPVVAPIAASDKGVDPMSLPQVDTAAAAGPTPSPGSPPRAPTVVAAGGPPAAPTAAASAAPADPNLVAVVPTAAPSTTSSASLEQLMQQAAGQAASAPATATAAATDNPTATAPGSVPFRPSMGAINGALGAAMPGARACLGPDDPISRATVTFQSDGTVQSVSVTGGAAGKPAEGCIRAALMKARVQPFAVPTFSAPATIRPN